MQENNFKIDFIGIGVPRAGTSWIHQCLSEHPQICAARGKELHFLNDPNKYNQGVSLYVSYFAHCQKDKIKGEYTPGYMANKATAHLIKKYFPEVKLITCLRNPIERAYSHYLFHKRTEETNTKTFEEAIEGELKVFYINMSFYYSQLKNYLELFPQNNVLILIYEDISKNPVEFIQRIYQFLGVNADFIPPSANKEINWTPSNPFRIPLLNLVLVKIKRYLYHRSESFKPVVFLLKKIKVNRLIKFIMSTNSKKRGLKRYNKPPLSQKTRKYLQEIYQTDIKNLEKLINRDLSFWK